MPEWTIPYSKSRVFPRSTFTKSTLFQTLETFQTMYITKQIYIGNLAQFILMGMCIGIKI